MTENHTGDSDIFIKQIKEDVVGCVVVSSIYHCV